MIATVTIDFSLLQLAMFGFFTGLGTTFGAELARFTFAMMSKKLKR